MERKEQKYKTKHAKHLADSYIAVRKSTKHAIRKYKSIPSGLLYSTLVVTDS